MCCSSYLCAVPKQTTWHFDNFGSAEEVEKEQHRLLPVGRMEDG